MRTNVSVKRKETLAAQMHKAVNELDADKVRTLLASGVPADVWGITDDYDLPLQTVSRRNSAAALSIAKALVEAGAAIDFQGDYDCTALARAIETNGSNRDDWAIARYLISAGANPCLYDKDGLCPAEYANSNGNNDAVLAMLDAGMDPNSSGISGPLIWYMSYDSPEVVKALLARGVDPNAAAFGIACQGETPLQRAAEALDDGGDEDTFRAIAIQLIQAGADPAQIDPTPDCLAAFLLARKEQSAFSDLPPGKVGTGSNGPL